VLADAVTSLLAIAGLLAAKIAGWTFMDPLVGLVGTGVILSWAYGLLRQSGETLLDAVPDRALAARIREELELDGDVIADLHLWRVGPGHDATLISIISGDPKPPEIYKARLAHLPRLSHITIEVIRCPGHDKV
jgi:Co/Zn/Cd efflux system component